VTPHFASSQQCHLLYFLFIADLYSYTAPIINDAHYSTLKAGITQAIGGRGLKVAGYSPYYADVNVWSYSSTLHMHHGFGALYVLYSLFVIRKIPAALHTHTHTHTQKYIYTIA